MAELSEIRGGISSVNSKLPRMYRNDDMPWRKKKRKSRSLKTGEIIQGTVVKTISPKEVLVRLPIGTLRAFINGKLKAGDTVYFKVQKVEPNLVLRIYGVSSKMNGKEFSDNELLRILYLPVNNFYRNLVMYAKKNQSIILRDDLIRLGKNFSDIDDVEIEQLPIDDIFRILVFMQESKLPFSKELFSRITPLFKGSKYFLNLLREFENVLEILPDKYKNGCKAVFNNIKNNNPDYGYMFNVLALRAPRDQKSPYLYPLLANILEAPDLSSGSFAKLKSIAAEIIEIIEGQFIINSFAWDSAGPVHIYLPIPYNDSYYITQVIIREDIALSNKQDKNWRFSFVTETTEEEEIKINSNIYGKNLSIRIQAPSSETALTLKAHSIRLQAALKNNGLILKAINVSVASDETDNATENAGRSRPTNFSVVV